MLKVTNSAIIFPLGSSLIMPTTFLFLHIGKNLVSLFKYLVSSNFASHLLQCLSKNLLSLSDAKSCQCPWNITLSYFHIFQYQSTRSKEKNTDIPTEKRYFKTEKYAHFSILNKCLSYWNHLQNVLKTHFKGHLH